MTEFKITLRNPYVIIIGITDYSNSKPKGRWSSLYGVDEDVKLMIKLWSNIYGYQDIHIISDTKDNNKNSDATMGKQQLMHTLVHIRAKINVNQSNDGLILYYSGHGTKNRVVLSDGQKVSTQYIKQVFSGENCVHLRNLPKIFIIDTGRGQNISQTYEARWIVNKSSNNDKNSWIDRQFHPYSGFATIFANCDDETINDSNYGSCLSRSIYKVLSQPDFTSKNTLRQCIIPIRKETKINAGKGYKEYGGATQCVDFHETFEYQVCFGKYDSEWKNCFESNVEKSDVLLK